MSKIKVLIAFFVGAVLTVLLATSGASAHKGHKGHHGHHGHSKNKNNVVVTAPCNIVFGSKTKIQQKNKFGPNTLTFTNNCAINNITHSRIGPGSVVVSRVRTGRFNVSGGSANVSLNGAFARVSGGAALAQAGGGVGAEAPIGGAKAGGGTAASGLAAVGGSVTSIGYGVHRLLRVRREF